MYGIIVPLTSNMYFSGDEFRPNDIIHAVLDTV